MPPKTNCDCNCAPCACPNPTGEGCVPDLCVPRPCFFNGQLITSDDLNAIVSHFRARDLMTGRFIGGWGIYGGLVVDAAPGLPHERLGNSATQTSPNPQIIAGTTVQVSAGVAIDANGRSLNHCGPTILDLAALAAQSPRAPQTQSCSKWIEGVPLCGQVQSELTATEYWLVAEYDETPTRPAPQYSGGGACDPAPTCDYTRKREFVRFALVPPLANPWEYQLTGCLDARTLALEVDPPEAAGDDGQRIRQWYEFFDVLNTALAAQCCARPAVLLSRVLFISEPGALRGELPPAPVYTILDDAYPLRRIVASSALNQLASLAVGGSSGPPVLARVTVVSQGGAQNVSGRGVSSVVSNNGVFTVTLDSSLPIDQRVLSVTPYTQPPAVLVPRILDTGNATFDVSFIDIANNVLADPAAFGITAHSADGGGA